MAPTPQNSSCPPRLGDGIPKNARARRIPESIPESIPDPSRIHSPAASAPLPLAPAALGRAEGEKAEEEGLGMKREAGREGQEKQEKERRVSPTCAPAAGPAVRELGASRHLLELQLCHC